MPKSTNINRLMADYVSQAGLTRVYIGVQTQTKGMVSGFDNINQVVISKSNAFLILLMLKNKRRLCVKCKKDIFQAVVGSVGQKQNKIS